MIYKRSADVVDICGYFFKEIDDSLLLVYLFIMIKFFFPNLICSPTRRKIFIDLISTSLPPGRYTEFFFRLSPALTRGSIVF